MLPLIPIYVIPRLCLVAWLVEPSSTLYQLTRGMWMLGLLGMAGLSILSMLRLLQKWTRYPFNPAALTIAGLSVLSFLAAVALGLGHIAWAAWLIYGVRSVFSIRRQSLRSWSSWTYVVVGLSLAMAVTVGSLPGLLLALAAELSVIRFGKGTFWKLLEQKGTREDFLLKSGEFCKVGGG